MMEGPGADSEEKHEPASDIDTAVADSLKVLDPKWPIREADMARTLPEGGLQLRDLRTLLFQTPRPPMTRNTSALNPSSLRGPVVPLHRLTRFGGTFTVGMALPSE